LLFRKPISQARQLVLTSEGNLLKNLTLVTFWNSDERNLKNMAAIGKKNS